MNSHHAKIQLNNSTPSRFIPLRKSINNNHDDDTNPGSIIVRDRKYFVADKNGRRHKHSIALWKVMNDHCTKFELNRMKIGRVDKF